MLFRKAVLTNFCPQQIEMFLSYLFGHKVLIPKIKYTIGNTSANKTRKVKDTNPSIDISKLILRKIENGFCEAIDYDKLHTGSLSNALQKNILNLM